MRLTLFFLTLAILFSPSLGFAVEPVSVEPVPVPPIPAETLPKAKPSEIKPLKPSTGLPQFQPRPGESKGQAELRRTRELRAMRAMANAKARQGKSAAKSAKKEPTREWTIGEVRQFTRFNRTFNRTQR